MVGEAEGSCKDCELGTRAEGKQLLEKCLAQFLKLSPAQLP